MHAAVFKFEHHGRSPAAALESGPLYSRVVRAPRRQVPRATGRALPVHGTVSGCTVYTGKQPSLSDSDFNLNVGSEAHAY